eukprot:CAMPEP_0197704732 /NCGR_PEP_ID=MMETSP1338-20131121/126082_1 /TAXON_ID=43686 ORGANISM="Pelagodinium beii, Strain RCC1491" /NCGR_SAMPLE_ID=MMETSP1338 /ASSEMBLY_ACC=CAM_ASM_000754 /LENGTH=558 /DNA_ID=CAMNT_0043288635 /DNA_START=47 /DNA_END=1723 /DNA_ORIENTATION=+
MARSAQTLLLLLATVHGKEYEWAGIFETPENHYMWTAQKVDGDYADPAMKLVALPATSFGEADLDSLEAAGDAAMALACTELSAGQTIVPATNTCYTLKFDPDAWQSLYPVDASSVSGIAFFAEHYPTEFENTAHYFKDSVGEDIEPQAELPHEESTEKIVPTGSAIGASILVNLVTFVGVVLMVPAVSRAAKAKQEIFLGVLFAFAAGALLSCAFFLLLFESTHLVATGWTAEVDVLWRWGTMILAGLILPAFIETLATFALKKLMCFGDGGTMILAGLILPAFIETLATFALIASGKEQKPEEEKPEVIVVGTAETADGAPVVPTEAASQEKSLTEKADFKVRARLIGGVCVGDFFHNLCDGFFLGAAFKGCGESFGWGVAAATLLHEIPQEIADFAVLTALGDFFHNLCDGFFLGAAFKGCGESFGWGVAAATLLHEIPQEIADFAILTGPEAGLSNMAALAVNFVSGLSVLLGTAIILFTDVSNDAIGLLLAFGGGVYIHVGAVDCMPKMYNSNFSLVQRLACLLSFIVGAVAIGLILIGHEHCVPEGGDGHAH